jgi:hypothetical protein
LQEFDTIGWFMLERIEFADIENALTVYLTARLTYLSDTVAVVTEVPDPRPSRMVLVARNDCKKRVDREDWKSRRGAHLILDRPRLVFTCSDDAGGSARSGGAGAIVRDRHWPGYIGTVWCDRVEDAGAETDLDPVTSTLRHIFTADLTVRGKALG